MLSLLVWNSMRLTEKFLLDQLQHRVQELQPLLNASLAGPLLEEDLVTLQEIMKQFQSEEIRYLSVTNSLNEHMVTVGEAAALGESDFQGRQADVYVIQMPIQIGSQSIGYLRLQLDVQYIAVAIATVRQQGFGIALVEIVLSILLLSFVGLALTRNLQQLTEAARTMSEGDLSVRIPVSTHDEIGEAATTFNRMADAISRQQGSLLENEQRIRRLNERLEQRVEQRTRELQASNEQLSGSLEQLQRAQAHIVQTEKMAALGGLVAGVAHEINTPLGVSVTAASHLKTKLKTYTQQYETGELTREGFESWLHTTDESANIILANLERAAKHIRSFKQIAVDQSDDDLRNFNLKHYLAEILQSLQPKLKKTRHEVVLECPDDLDLNSNPGALSQIVTNLVMNSLTHGFDGIEKGRINILVERMDGKINMVYTDNGIGIPEENIKKIFEPFFSTRRGQGGSGLGLHIVYNLVTQTLGGEIDCTSTPGEGVRFDMLLPVDINN